MIYTVKCKFISSFLLHKRVSSVLLNAPHPEKIALTNVAHKSKFPHFQILRTCKVPKKLVNQHNTVKIYQTLNIKNDRTVFFLPSIFLVFRKFLRSSDRGQGTAGCYYVTKG